MFFIPWSVAIVTGVISCILIIVFFRIFPLWFGALLGLMLTIINPALQALALFIVITFIVGGILATIATKTVGRIYKKKIAAAVLCSLAWGIFSIGTGAGITQSVFFHHFQPQQRIESVNDANSIRRDIQQHESDMDTFYTAYSVMGAAGYYLSLMGVVIFFISGVVAVFENDSDRELPIYSQKLFNKFSH